MPGARTKLRPPPQTQMLLPILQRLILGSEAPSFWLQCMESPSWAAGHITFPPFSGNLVMDVFSRQEEERLFICSEAIS